MKAETPSHEPDTGFSIHGKGSRSRVDILQPSIAREILGRYDGRRQRFVGGLIEKAFGSRTIVVSEGTRWRETHDAMSPYFTPVYVQDRYVPAIRKVADETFKALQSKIESGDAPQDFQIEKTMRQITTRIMGFVLFGEALTPDEGERISGIIDRTTRIPPGKASTSVAGAIGAMFRLVGLENYQPTRFSKELRSAYTELRDWIGSKLAETEEKGRPVPLLDALQKRFETHGRKAQQKAVTAEYALLLIGGIETTAAALTFAVVEVANNEKIRKKATEEANRPTPPSIISGPMVHVFQETLRRHTIARAVARQAGPDEDIGGTAIPKGADYQFFPAKYHMDKTVWPDPKTFDPGRFENLDAAQKQSYLPYSTGPMICLGRHLAQAEGVVIMTSFLQHLTTEGIGTLGYVRKNISATQRPEDAKVGVCPLHRFFSTSPK